MTEVLQRDRSKTVSIIAVLTLGILMLLPVPVERRSEKCYTYNDRYEYLDCTKRDTHHTVWLPYAGYHLTFGQLEYALNPNLAFNYTYSTNVYGNVVRPEGVALARLSVLLVISLSISSGLYLGIRTVMRSRRHDQIKSHDKSDADTPQL
jgi:hypothetical protein